MTWVVACIVCILLVELVRRLPILSVSSVAISAGESAIRTIASDHISEHWKEKAVFGYAMRLLGATLRLIGFLIAVGLLVALLLYLGELTASGFSDWIFSFSGVVFSIAVASGYAVARDRMDGRQNEEQASAYNPMDRMLHRLALKYKLAAKMLFDLGVWLAKADRAETAAGKHVFVSGLARSGTTVLMRRFYNSGAFRSLTYRDMPFVIAPNLWAKVPGGFQKKIEASERAHGDGIVVDADSPESFDEAFWRLFDGPSFIKIDRLIPHHPTDALLTMYQDYVGIVLSGAKGQRYLSKNNNNILRLPELARAFPNSVILVPFRDPIPHAASLRNQHVRFVKRQASDPFEAEYMGYLAHHEFGQDQRPFRLGSLASAKRDPSHLDYWLEMWIDVYDHLRQTLPPNAELVCYETLCEDPAVWARLASLAGLAGDDAVGETFVLSQRHQTEDVDANLAQRAADLYRDLRTASVSGGT